MNFSISLMDKNIVFQSCDMHIEIFQLFEGPVISQRYLETLHVSYITTSRKRESVFSRLEILTT